ncbi:HEPN domain-containing protein [Bacteroides cellulosilyticus]|jgi:hypothetical protein|uniref:RiboL-PSP-HEPN domain-containing protein n=1 Tax=Bacteroides cellulosilyticus TaxID=246787 RepID=A0A5M6A230_9BACE|nr:HEPN domain-containing protein [Bacteroides cellulosilyticus]KAA5403136.1 hypothetical protein F2Y86_24595 [Bacteroides cellulosilyticus]RYU12177.1 hypothetical protein EAJ01_24635 [Bacteroides cellulosilyticus]
MSKKIYVNGGILITTPYFRYAGGGALYSTPPEGAEMIETNTTDENGSYLEINDEHPQSIFNEYYAATFFTTFHMWADFFHRDYTDAYNDYLERIDNTNEVINIENLNIKQQNIVNRLLYVSIVASLETFICDIVLTKITRDEEAFYKYFESRPYSDKKKEEMLKLKDDNIGKWEQCVIEEVMKTVFSNIKTIKDVYKDVFNISISDTGGKMKMHFYKRNLLAHKNGRKKDGSYMNITKDDLNILVEDSKTFVRQIMEELNI